VSYAGLEDHPDHALVGKSLSGKASGLLTFGVKAAKGSPHQALAQTWKTIIRFDTSGRARA
jgi:O-acetylhomoserine (thiol)-lyase